MYNIICNFILLFVLLTVFQLNAVETPDEWNDSEDTVFALVPNNGTPLMTDITGVYTPTVTGGTFGSEQDMGGYIQLANDGDTGISFNYNGSDEVLKGHGFTLEAWIKPETGALTSGAFITKIGTFALSFSNDTMKLSWLSLPSVPIYIEPGSGRYDYYPMSLGFNGLTSLTMSEWNHIVLTYDEDMKLLRSWINGVLDRDCEVFREGQQWVKIPTGYFGMFSNLHNCKIAGIRLRAGVYNPAVPPAMKAYLNQLPWENKMVLTMDKIDPSLDLPITISAVLTGIGTYTTTLNSWQETASIDIPIPGGSAAISNMTVTASADGTQVFSQNLYYNNNIPSSPVPTGGVTVNSDKSISKDGVKVFPRFLYHAQNDDLEYFESMGFNMATAKDPNGTFNGIQASNITAVQAYAAEAATDNLYCTLTPRHTDANFDTYMAIYPNFSNLLFWYCADEPWNNWDVYIARYNNIRIKDPDHPSFVVSNNTMHMKNSSTIADIMGCDPYPLPNVALRHVFEHTRAAAKASFELKPVWTVLDAYNGKMPTVTELRCMAFLALAGGANGIGIYAWDDRLFRDGAWTGYYMPDDYPGAVSVVSTVMLEMESLEDILVEANVADAATINTEQPAIHAAIKRVNGVEYLLIVNDSRQAETGTISLSSGKTALAQPLSESAYTSSLQFTNGSCQITLPAMGTGIFEVPVGQCPYWGTPFELPCTIQAEDYDLGGEGIAYHDGTSGNYGALYRDDDVDITTTADTGGGYYVGWFWVNDWMEYTISVPETGYYDIDLRTWTSSNNASALLSIDGISIGSISIPNTGSPYIYQTSTLSNIEIASGIHVFRVTDSGASFGLNWIEFVKND